MTNNDVDGLVICHLCTIKNAILNAKGGVIQLQTGYITSAHYIDRAVKMILEKQTEIEDLRSDLRIEKEYAEDWGDFFGFTPQDMTEEERKELRDHMKAFSEKWRKRQEESKDE